MVYLRALDVNLCTWLCTRVSDQHLCKDFMSHLCNDLNLHIWFHILVNRLQQVVSLYWYNTGLLLKISGHIRKLYTPYRTVLSNHWPMDCMLPIDWFHVAYMAKGFVPLVLTLITSLSALVLHVALGFMKKHFSGRLDSTEYIKHWAAAIWHETPGFQICGLQVNIN